VEKFCFKSFSSCSIFPDNGQRPHLTKNYHRLGKLRRFPTRQRVYHQGGKEYVNNFIKTNSNCIFQNLQNEKNAYLFFLETIKKKVLQIFKSFTLIRVHLLKIDQIKRVSKLFNTQKKTCVKTICF